MKKLLIALMAVASLGVFSSAASAHRVSQATASASAHAFSNPDCGRAWDWTCIDHDIGTKLSAVGAHSWHVRTYYTESYVLTANVFRTCHTTTRVFHDGSVAASRKYCGKNHVGVPNWHF